MVSTPLLFHSTFNLKARVHGFGRAHNLSHPLLLNWSGHRWDTKPHQKTASKEGGSRGRVYVKLWLIHIAVQHKPTQHGKKKKCFQWVKAFVTCHGSFSFLLATFSNHGLMFISGIFFFSMGPEDITFHSY